MQLSLRMRLLTLGVALSAGGIFSVGGPGGLRLWAQEPAPSKPTDPPQTATKAQDKTPADGEKKQPSDTAPATPPSPAPPPPASTDPPPDLVYPLSIAVAPAGDMFLADRNAHSVWKVSGETLSLFSHGSPKFRTPLNAIRCVEIDSDGNVLAGDSSTRDVYRLDATGKPTGLARPSTKDFGIGIPMDIVVDSQGDLLVSDLERPGRIWRVPKAGGQPQEVLKINAPRGIAIDSEDRLWVIANRSLVRLTSEGKPETIVEDGVFSYPHTVVVDKQGTAYVCDGYAAAIWRVAAGKKPEKWVSGEPLVRPVGIAWQGENLVVVDPHAKAVIQITPDGKPTRLEIKPARN